MILEGYVKNKNNEPMENAMVEIKGEDFITIYSTESDEKGYYRFDIPESTYPFMIAVKDYAVKYLEYWSQNIPLTQNMSLDVRVDMLEIYGLHAFRVKGAGNTLMIYFRPMSLAKFQQGEKDIAPELAAVKVVIDEKEVPVILQNEVKEFAGGKNMMAYLIQVDTSDIGKEWKKLEVEIRDKEDNFGAASIFCEG